MLFFLCRTDKKKMKAPIPLLILLHAVVVHCLKVVSKRGSGKSHLCTEYCAKVVSHLTLPRTQAHNFKKVALNNSLSFLKVFQSCSLDVCCFYTNCQFSPDHFHRNTTLYLHINCSVGHFLPVTKRIMFPSSFTWISAKCQTYSNIMADIK